MNESERRLLEADAQRRMPTGETERPRALGSISKVIFDTSGGGANVHDAIREGIDFSNRTFGIRAGFEFNGVNITVDFASNPDLIYRDYERALHGFTRNQVGPSSKEKLSARTLEREARKREESLRELQGRINSLGKTPEASK